LPSLVEAILGQDYRAGIPNQVDGSASGRSQPFVGMDQAAAIPQDPRSVAMGAEARKSFVNDFEVGRLADKAFI